MGKQALTTTPKAEDTLKQLIEIIKKIIETTPDNTDNILDRCVKDQLEALRSLLGFYQDLLSQGENIKPRHAATLKKKLGQLNLSDLCVDEWSLFKILIEKELAKLLPKVTGEVAKEDDFLSKYKGELLANITEFIKRNGEAIQQPPSSNLSNEVERIINAIDLKPFVWKVSKSILPTGSAHLAINETQIVKALKKALFINESKQFTVVHPQSYAAAMAILTAIEQPGFIASLTAKPEFQPEATVFDKASLLQQIKKYLANQERPAVKEQLQKNAAVKEEFDKELSWLNAQKSTLIDVNSTLAKASSSEAVRIQSKAISELMQQVAKKQVTYALMPDYLPLANKNDADLQLVAVKSVLDKEAAESLQEAEELLKKLAEKEKELLENALQDDYKLHEKQAKIFTSEALDINRELQKLTQCEAIDIEHSNKKLAELKTRNDEIKTFAPKTDEQLLNYSPAHRRNIIALYTRSATIAVHTSQKYDTVQSSLECKRLQYDLKRQQEKLDRDVQEKMSANVMDDMTKALTLLQKQKTANTSLLSKVASIIQDCNNAMDLINHDNERACQELQKNKNEKITAEKTLIEYATKINKLGSSVDDSKSTGQVIENIETAKLVNKTIEDRTKQIIIHCASYSEQQFANAEHDLTRVTSINNAISPNIDFHAIEKIKEFAPPRLLLRRTEKHSGFNNLLEFLAITAESEQKKWWDLRNATTQDNELVKEFKTLVTDKLEQLTALNALKKTKTAYEANKKELDRLHDAFKALDQNRDSYQETIAAKEQALVAYAEEWQLTQQNVTSFQELQREIEEYNKQIEKDEQTIPCIIELTRQTSEFTSSLAALKDESLPDAYKTYRQLEALTQKAGEAFGDKFKGNAAILEKNLPETLNALRERTTNYVTQQTTALDEALDEFNSFLSESEKQPKELSDLYSILQVYNQHKQTLAPLITCFVELKAYLTTLKDDAFTSSLVIPINQKIQNSEVLAHPLQDAWLSGISEQLEQLKKNVDERLATINVELTGTNLEEQSKALASANQFIADNQQIFNLAPLKMELEKLGDEDRAKKCLDLQTCFAKLKKVASEKQQGLERAIGQREERYALVKKYSDELSAYNLKRRGVYRTKDRLFSKDKKEREALIENIITEFKTYKKTGNRAKLFELVQNYDYPGRKLRPLVSRLIYAVLDLENPDPKAEPELNSDVYEEGSINDAVVYCNLQQAEQKLLKIIKRVNNGDMHKALEQLKGHILAMREHGVKIGSTEGSVAKQLANSLLLCMYKFVKENEAALTSTNDVTDAKPKYIGQEEMDKFKFRFDSLLHSEDDKFIQHKQSVMQIIGNVALALISFGMAIPVRLIYSKYRNGYTSLFFSETESKCLVRDMGADVQNMHDYVMEFGGYNEKSDKNFEEDSLSL